MEIETYPPLPCTFFSIILVVAVVIEQIEHMDHM
jgi:hypothetical protein